MKVTLRDTWFAPTEEVMVDAIRSVSGRRFIRGTHFMPDELLPFLPSSAIVEDGPADMHKAKPGEDWRVVADVERAGVEAAAKLHAEADKKLANKQAAVAKAREAKLRKKLEREAAEAAAQ